MAIDFTLTRQQRELQLDSRKFAGAVLAGARVAESLPTPEERFLATKPAYEAMVAAGFLRKCIPAPAGGEGAGLVDMAIMAEELYSVNASVTLTMLGTVLGILPILLGGTPDQCGRLLAPFLRKSGAPLAGFCSSEPGGSANAGSPPPGEGVRTTAKLEGDSWLINGRKKWVSSATGWDRKGADVLRVVCRTDPDAAPDKAISIIAVERPTPGIVFERAIDSVGHRAHLTPQFGFKNVAAPRHNLLGQEGSGLALTAASFTGTAALVGILELHSCGRRSSSRCTSRARSDAAVSIRSSSIKQWDMHWPTPRPPLKRLDISAGARATPSTVNLPPLTNLQYKRKFMAPKLRFASSPISCAWWASTVTTMRFHRGVFYKMR